MTTDATQATDALTTDAMTTDAMTTGKEYFVGGYGQMVSQEHHIKLSEHY